MHILNIIYNVLLEPGGGFSAYIILQYESSFQSCNIELAELKKLESLVYILNLFLNNN